ncbi:MAG: hypothetical protein M3Q52_01845 [Pseudomonadota bacterium]|nr:hypothetical protein [Pseudomonadota bacterium]
MFRLSIACLGLGLSAPLAAQTAANLSASFNPRALELFERDGMLMNWALRRFDSDGDVRLSLAEAQPAALEFKSMADGDGDGRVTTYEFDRAKEFILARY